ncbi:hypothetical protein PSE_0139 [Pseudovibrio sp. FO-BEG1]|nr:hypothetical protein PSE_0139 [Pseudovibrio sp. FO-BEG1]
MSGRRKSLLPPQTDFSRSVRACQFGGEMRIHVRESLLEAPVSVVQG